MLPLIAAQGVAVILMHMSARYPATLVGDDPDIVQTVRADLAERFAAAVAAGISSERIVLDPGIGFGKTMRDNWRLAADARGILPAEIPARGGGGWGVAEAVSGDRAARGCEIAGVVGAIGEKAGRDGGGGASTGREMGGAGGTDLLVCGRGSSGAQR